MRNDLESADTPATADPSSGLSRRQVVRIGANLAWAVPAVSVVTTAPALAASGKAKLVAPTFAATAKKPTTKSGQIVLAMGAVSNSGPGDAGVPSATFSLSPKPAITKVTGSSGWSQVGGSKGLKFTSKAGKLLAKKKTSPLTVTVTYTPKVVKKKPVVAKGTAKVVVTASNSVPASVSKTDKY